MIEVLLVEDDEGDIFMLREVMDEAGFDNNLHVVHNGEDALKFLRDTSKPKIDFIITDINMPRMNGHEFLAEVSKDSVLRKIPVAVLTNSQETEDFIKSHELNATTCLSKPLNQSKVTEIVQSVERFWFRNAYINSEKRA